MQSNEKMRYTNEKYIYISIGFDHIARICNLISEIIYIFACDAVRIWLANSLAQINEHTIVSPNG